MAGGSIPFLPRVPIFMSQLRHTGTPWGEPASLGAMVNAVGEFAGSEYERGARPGADLLRSHVLGPVRARSRRSPDRARAPYSPAEPCLAMATAGTLAVAIAGSLVSRSAFQARYASVVLPIFLLLAVLGTATLATAGSGRGWSPWRWGSAWSPRRPT